MSDPIDLEGSLRKALILNWDYTERIKDGIGSFLPNQCHKRIRQLIEKIRGHTNHSAIFKRLIKDKDKRASLGAMMWVFDDPWVSERLRNEMRRKLTSEVESAGLNSLIIRAFLGSHNDTPPHER